MITGKMYVVLKFIALILLPALGTLYFTLAGIWGLPAAEQVLGTIASMDTFLGVLLGISSKNFNAATEGTLKITDTGEKKTFLFDLDGDPEYQLEGKDRVVFKVERTSE